MLSSLDNFIQAIAFGHARRDVQRYLDAATRSMYMYTASTSQTLPMAKLQSLFLFS